MDNKIKNTNVSANRDAKANGAPEGLDAEVHNHNKKPDPLMDTEVNAPRSSVEAFVKPPGAPKDLESLKRLVRQVWKVGVRNADNEGLDAIKLYPRILEGHVLEVNGGLAEEVPAFVPTRDELMQLVTYWTKTELLWEFFHFRLRMSSSAEFRRMTFARRRVARIEKLLGNDLVEFAKAQAYEEFGKEQDPQEWHVFLNGTEQERKEMQNEIARKMQEDRARQEASVNSGNNHEDATSIQGGAEVLN